MSEEIKQIDNVAAVILAGGKSRRMGNDKLSLMVGDMTMLQCIVAKFENLFGKMYLSVGDINKYPEVKIERISDIFPGSGPLGGLHAALKTIEEIQQLSGVFLIAADLPFVNTHAAKIILDNVDDCDVCVPVDNEGRYEPLFAYYSKSIIPFLEDSLNKGMNKVIDFYPNVKIKTISIEELKNFAAEDLFFNVNYPGDYLSINNCEK